MPRAPNRYTAMKTVTASAMGMVSHMPETPMSLGRMRIKTTTRMSERMEEMSAEMRARFAAGKQLEDRLMQYKYSPRSREEIIDMFSKVIGVSV